MSIGRAQTDLVSAEACTTECASGTAASQIAGSGRAQNDESILVRTSTRTGALCVQWLIPLATATGGEPPPDLPVDLNARNVPIPDELMDSEFVAA